jgi:plastocyanin
MRPRICAVLICAAGLICAHGYGHAQEVTLSARIKVTENDRNLESSHAENVVVWLTPIGAQPMTKFVPKQPMRLTQHNKSFEPHLLVVPVGAIVQFPNRDPFFHNVFSLFEGKRFDLGLYEAGTTRNVSFDRPGISFIFCNIHAEMSAIVIALETPYYGISNRKGEIVIPKVPAGHYTMRAWSETALAENLNSLTREITVSENSSTLGVVQITGGAVSTAHKNKFGMDYEPPAPNSPAYDRP